MLFRSLGAHTWEAIEPLIDDDACFIFSDGTFVGKANIENAIRKTFALIDSGDFDQHGEYFFVPGLRAEFTAAEISALIAPRPHLSLIGRDDPLTPPAGVQSINKALSAAYASLEKPQHWQQKVFDCAHQETAEMRTAVLRFLVQYG